MSSAMYDLAGGDQPATADDRSVLDECLVREVSRSRRTGVPFAIMAVALDDFEDVNAAFSSAAGDAALELVGEGLLGGSRAIDTVCRRGGGEFLIVMPTIDADNAFQRAEEFRAHLDGLTLCHDGHDVPISVSIGVASFPLDGTTETQTVDAANRALALARESRGHRTVVA